MLRYIKAVPPPGPAVLPPLFPPLPQPSQPQPQPPPPQPPPPPWLLQPPPPCSEFRWIGCRRFWPCAIAQGARQKIPARIIHAESLVSVFIILLLLGSFGINRMGEGSLSCLRLHIHFSAWLRTVKTDNFCDP